MLKDLSKLTQNAKNALKNAYEIASNLKKDEVVLSHLFVALLQGKQYLSSQILSSFGIDYSPIIQKIMSSSGIVGEINTAPKISKEIRTVVQRAHEISSDKNLVYVGTEHLLIAMFSITQDPFVKELANLGLNLKTIKDRSLSIATYPPGVFMYIGTPDDLDRGSLVESIGRDLTELARENLLMPLIGREKEIEKMISILSRKTKNNPVIVGESGVGKTALVEGLAERIASGSVPYSLKDKKIISIDTASIVAGSKIRGELEEKVLGIIDEVRNNNDLILFIDEIHTILGAGSNGGGTMDIADILKPALANGELRCIGATTVSDYQHIFEEDSALSRRFQPVNVEELSIEQTITVLSKIKKVFEEYHGVKVTNEAVEAAAKLSSRYIYDRFLPDKAIDLIDEACAREKLYHEGKLPSKQKIESELVKAVTRKEAALKKKSYEEALSLRNIEKEISKKLKESEKLIENINNSSEKVVTEEAIRKIVSDWTGVPLESLSRTDLEAVRKIDVVLKKFIIGQDEAISRVSKALKRSRVGISDSSRPMAGFLFLGPTGVGKTELARVVARELFGSEESLIQIDMSEMMEPHSISKIIGAPPGYVGYQEGGQLTDKIRRRPYSVVLFDEIEKAHPDVLNLLLQIFEYGQLTDSKGRVANFKNAIIILTSNIGAEEINKDKTLGFDVSLDAQSEERVEKAYDDMKETLMEELKNELRPEFLNRLDDIVIFRALNSYDAVLIVKLLVDKLVKRLKDQNIKLSVTKSVYEYIAKKGFDEDYGARPLRRFVQDEIESMIADFVIDQGLADAKEETTSIKIDCRKDKLFIV